MKGRFLFHILTLTAANFERARGLVNVQELTQEQHLAIDKMLSGLSCAPHAIRSADQERETDISKREAIHANGLTLDLDLLRATQIPVPQWLTDFTGLTQWPGLDPPYIPLDFIDFDKIPNYQPYTHGSCPIEGRETCSFECYKCVAPEEIFSCSQLSQTFDDGPTFATQRLLNKFASTGQKSTFFNLGINVVSHPDIYQRMIHEDHLIGTHTWSHAHLPSLSNEQIIAQIQWSIWAMNATGGHIPKWFRPPYGAIDNRVRAITRQFGLQAVLWNYDTFDWMLLNEPFVQRTEEQILSEVIEWNNQHPRSGLILEHDGSLKTVEVAEKIADILGPDQFTVNMCVGGIDYIKTF